MKPRFAKLATVTVAALMSVSAATSANAENLTIALASEPTSVDPHFHNLTPNLAVANYVFESLISQNAQQQLQPALAVSWEPVDDLTWEFRLREGVRFHDGSVFNADDVLCSWERAPNVPNSPSGFGSFTQGKTLTRVDDYTIRFTTEAPYPLLPNDVSQIYIVSDSIGCDATTEQYNSGEAAIGTGPFRLVSYEPNEAFTYIRNEDYWGELPEWTNVELRPISSGPSRVAALLAGDVDMIEGVPTADIATLRSNDDIALSQGSSNRVIYLVMDQFRENSPFITANDGSPIRNPFLDQRVREAVSLAINRAAIVERVMEGVAIPAGQLVPEGFFGRSDNLEVPEYDLEAARALLEEAGYGDGFRMTIHGPNDRYINDARVLEAIGQMLSRLGIEISVETMPRSIYFQRASTGGEGGLPEFSFILVGWGSASGEASSPLRALVHTYDSERGFGPSNRGRYSNPDLDAMIEEALGTVDDATRQALLAEATEIAMNDLAVIPTHFQVNTWATREGLSYDARTDERTLAIGVHRN